MRALFNFLLIGTLIGCASSNKKSEQDKETTASFPMSLEEAVSSDFRREENRARDIFRHPAETLSFFGIQPHMSVVEISPGTGWYTEILAPYLASSGHLYAAVMPAGESDYLKKMNETYMEWLKSHPTLEKSVTIMSFNPGKEPVAPDGSADMVLTFRNVHNWMSRGISQAAFDAFFKALKPGGVLGVVEHRAPEKQKFDPKASSGYVRESDVIRFAEKAGFKLAEKSEVNANPKDTKNHPKGVWTLPPTLRLGEKNRERYMEIGESDRMTLKFVKP